jgi:hypothetical protein
VNPLLRSASPRQKDEAIARGTNQPNEVDPSAEPLERIREVGS